MEVMATAFQAPRRHCCPARPQPAEGTPTPPLEAPELTAKSGSITCVVTAPFSWAMVHTGFCCAFQESLSQSCESSGVSMVGLMVTSSKRAYARPRSTAPRAPALRQSTADPHLHRRHSDTVLAQSLWGLWVLCTQGLFEPSEQLW